MLIKSNAGTFCQKDLRNIFSATVNLLKTFGTQFMSRSLLQRRHIVWWFMQNEEIYFCVCKNIFIIGLLTLIYICKFVNS